MAYSINLENSARRHLSAAESLYIAQVAGAQPGSKAVAGYLFGIAGELAVKKMMNQSGIAQLSSAERRKDPYYAHFPELKTLLKQRVQGRRAGALRTIAESSQIFRNWNTEMRYAPTSDVTKHDIESWRAEAKTLIAQMEERL